ncbi:MAG: DUF5989 family protein [Planctomycetota bacterium]|jgi:hypothetical protein
MNEPKQDQENEFLKAAGEKERGLVAEFVAFMAENKMWWLTPILIVFLLVGVLLVISATPLGAWVYSFV